MSCEGEPGVCHNDQEGADDRARSADRAEQSGSHTPEGGSVKPPLVQVRSGDTAAMDLRDWVRQYVRLLMQAEGVKVATTTPRPVQEASNDR